MEVKYRPGQTTVTDLKTGKVTSKVNHGVKCVCDICSKTIVESSGADPNEIKSEVYMVMDKRWAICRKCFDEKYILIDTGKKNSGLEKR